MIMEDEMKRLALFFVIALLATSFLAAGCGNGSAGTVGSVDTVAATSGKQTTVEEIARNPQGYDSVIVTTEGNYAVGYCSACFLLKDGVFSVRVEVSDTAPLPPESKLNARMQITGKIYVAQGSPNIVAENIIYK
ncbi:MAG: hypothetical protein A2W01_06710 [Candidatus Solincola sediminis]|uniref:Uncharacterized protein n=1 Tax=Candidatus Solincola sediminis TaxID=1797199 RepID=A0A1F2WEW9_9ACTN|nr:MAG: hypothetical protein A2Y75_09770 [Candidatus Solincola sediminis]OFW59141.1 MAG: hypothetical protein A2W01_06710 [Candidatus Solincola sediminis]